VFFLLEISVHRTQCTRTCLHRLSESVTDSYLSVKNHTNVTITCINNVDAMHSSSVQLTLPTLLLLQGSCFLSRHSESENNNYSPVSCTHNIQQVTKHLLELEAFNK